ncbi:MAG: type II secretion system protein [Ramlibacter sp.]
MKRGQHGFTYLWLLLVVALMGTGLAVVGEMHQTAAQRDREAELLSIGRQFRAALRSYHDAQRYDRPAAAGPAAAGPAGSGPVDPRQRPASLQELLQDPRFPGIKRHLRRVYVDPMTGKAEWGLVMEQGRIAGIHSLSTAVPRRQAGFEGPDLAFQGAEQYSAWVFALPLALQASNPVTATPTTARP